MRRSYSRLMSKLPTYKGSKKVANKKVRKFKDVADHRFYKKIFSSYDICDGKWGYLDKKDRGPVVRRGKVNIKIVKF